MSTHFIGTDHEGTRWYAEFELTEVNLEHRHFTDHTIGTLTHTFTASGFAIEKNRREASMAGQCLDQLQLTEFTPATGWTKRDIEELLVYWRFWHLNEMHAASDEQASGGKTADRNLGELDSHGYRLGSEWLAKQIPLMVRQNITRLSELPVGKVPSTY